MVGVELSTVIVAIKSTKSVSGRVVLSTNIVMFALLSVRLNSRVVVVVLKYDVLFPVVFAWYFKVNVCVSLGLRFPIFQVPVRLS